LNRDFLPSAWGYYRPTMIDIGIFTGTIGVFFTFFLLFMRWLPMVAMAEVKGTMAEADPHYGHKKHEHEHEHEAGHAGLVPEGAE
jgi:molybdopterin-containing oxidoreductase family membrane subunit